MPNEITVEEMCRNLIQQAIADGIVAGPWVRCSSGDLTGMANMLNGYLGARLNRWAAAELEQAIEDTKDHAGYSLESRYMDLRAAAGRIAAALESGSVPAKPA